MRLNQSANCGRANSAATNCGQTAKLSTSSSVTTVKNGPLASVRMRKPCKEIG